MITLEEFNRLSPSEACEELAKCCGAQAWVEGMNNLRPFKDFAQILGSAQRIWRGLSKDDWLEAFSHHPRIGDVSQLKAKFSSTAHWAQSEQKGAQGASDDLLKNLKDKNDLYFKKNGFIFLICATGKSAQEMYDSLCKRLNNDSEKEIKIAAEEQEKITALRLEKLIS